MNKKWRSKAVLLVFIACLTLIMTVNVFAFDKERKGFILGFGLGPGFSSYSEIISIPSTGAQQSSEKMNKVALFTDFKIGYAPSNQLMFYWLSKVNWFGREDTVQTATSTRKEDITIATGIGGLGATYFFHPEAPSIFISLGGGFSTRTYPFKGSDPWLSFGLTGSVGWEFKKNWALELSAIWGKPTHDIPEYDYSSYFTGIGFTISALGY